MDSASRISAVLGLAKVIPVTTEDVDSARHARVGGTDPPHGAMRPFDALARRCGEKTAPVLMRFARSLQARQPRPWVERHFRRRSSRCAHVRVGGTAKATDL